MATEWRPTSGAAATSRRTASAPQKWAENPNFSSIWDFDNDRYRTQYRHNFLFPFGGTFGHSFSLSSWGVDGDVGYTISPSGAGTRLAEWTTGGAWFKPDGSGLSHATSR